jgi:hypothetical protein
VRAVILLTVKYTCGLCDAVDAAVTLPARASDEDLIKWMDKLTLAISQDHMRRSPQCRARKLKHVQIPISNAEWVGGPPIQ